MTAGTAPTIVVTAILTTPIAGGSGAGSSGDPYGGDGYTMDDRPDNEAGFFDTSFSREALDCAKDTTAVQLAENIKNMQIPLEQGAIIFKDTDGRVTSGRIGIDSDMDGDVEMRFPRRVGYANVLGTLHHHSPTLDAMQDAEFFYADQYPSPQDWVDFADLADQVFAAGGSISDLSMYIVDQSGTVREYTVADRATYDLPIEQLKRGPDHPQAPPRPPAPVTPSCPA